MSNNLPVKNNNANKTFKQKKEKTIASLCEVEHFLKNFKKFKKCVNFIKFIK